MDNNELLKDWAKSYTEILRKGSGENIELNYENRIFKSEENNDATLTQIKSSINWDTTEEFSYTYPQHAQYDSYFTESKLSDFGNVNSGYTVPSTKVHFVTSCDISPSFKFEPSTEEHQPSDEQNYDRAMSLLHKL